MLRGAYKGPKSVEACQAHHIMLMVIAVKTMPKAAHQKIADPLILQVGTM